jgi:hypothetical protein
MQPRQLAPIVVCALAVSALALTRSTDSVLAPRLFYVTPGLFAGNQVLTACASGYHLASIWEIRDPSNFAYDTRRGLRNASYQAGPPAFLEAWLDDGQEPNVNHDCTGWTDSSGSFGRTAYLGIHYAGPVFYELAQTDCGEEHHVWCASDAYLPTSTPYVPSSMKER